MTTRNICWAQLASALFVGLALVVGPTTPVAAAGGDERSEQRDLSAEKAWLGHGLSETLADAVDDLPGQGLATEPGQVFAYTGMGFMVAGRIAEVVTGKEFSALMKEMLLDPIGATTATFSPSEKLKRQMPTPYSRKDGAFAKVDLSARTRARATFPNPAGGLISTLDDVGRFLLLHRNRGVANGKRLIAADSLAALYRAQPATGPDGYGLGFNVLKVGENGVGVRVRHIGASGTLAEVDFENDLLIVFLTQVPQAETLPFRQRLLQTIYAVFQ